MTDRSPSPALGPHRSYGWTIVWLTLLMALLGLGAWMGPNLKQHQAAYPGVSPSVTLAADKSYGVTADLTAISPTDLQGGLAHMSQLGLSWVRQPFPWAEIEPVPGQFDWERWDAVVEAVHGNGLQMIAVLDTTPEWARPADTPLHTPPTELADFGAFARAVAARYGDRVPAYQIWDEPNLSAHWGNRFVEPRAYARLLREGAINVREAQNEAIVLTAALAPTVEAGPLNLNEPEFLAQLYAANAGPWFDVVAAQPYGFEHGPGHPATRHDLVFARAQMLRQVMVYHGDGDKPIWVTAFGWSALPGDWSGAPSPWRSVSSQDQLLYTGEAIAYARATWPWLGPMLFAAWDANMLPADEPRRGLALMDNDSLLPPAVALKTAGLDASIATVGAYPAVHPSGHYQGDWRFSKRGVDVPREGPARLTIQFEGTRLDLLVRRGAYKGFLYVTIDGGPANHLPRQGGRAHLVLYDPLEQTDTVTLARFLPDGSHTAVIEADGGWYQWPIIGWRVSREADTRSIGWRLIAVGVLAMIIVVGLGHSVRRLPVRGWGEALHTRYLTLGTPIHLAILSGCALAFYLAPGTLLSLALLGLLFLAILPRPDLGLALVAFSIPFFLLPKSLAGRTISMTEVGLILVAVAWVVRRNLAGSPANRHWLDWITWILAGVAILSALLTVLPVADVIWPAADWSAPALMLLPLAGVLAAVAARRRWDGAQPEEDEEKGSWLSRLRASPVSQLDVAVGTLVGLALAATLAAENVGISFHEFHVVVWDSAAFYALIRLTRLPHSEHGKYLGLETAIVNRRMVDAFLVGITFMALYAIYQFLFTDQAITAEGVHRALGVYGSPNNLALLLGRAVPILVCLAAFSGRALRRGATDPERDKARLPEGDGLYRMMLGLALALTLVALVLTFSRGALLLGIPAALVFIGIMRGRGVLGLVLAALAAIGGGILPLLGTDRLRLLLSTDTGTGFFRLRLWQSAWAMLWDHPWLGVGLDNFLYQYRTRYVLPDAWQEPDLSHPHNLALDFGTRLGLGGIAVLLWVQVAFWQVALSLYGRLPQGRERALILGLMASMVATLAHGLIDNSFFLVDLAFIFFLTLGVVGSTAEEVSIQPTAISG